MYNALKEKVLKQNKQVNDYGLITLTWGNVSEIDRDLGVIAIKPSGVRYDAMQVDDIVVVDYQGNIVEGHLKPSSDLETHLCLYAANEWIGGVVHTHSAHATAYAQAGRPIVARGTTHADTFHGDVPCTRQMHDAEINTKYEYHTGQLIVETFDRLKLSLSEIPACLVHSHGPFIWGEDASKAVENALVLECVAMMNLKTESIQGSGEKAMQECLLDKHFNRKHGKEAYYGQ